MVCYMYVDQSVGWGLGPEFEWAFGYLITTLWVTGRAGQHSPALLGRTGPEEGEREVCEKSGHKHTASFVLVLVPLIYRWKDRQKGKESLGCSPLGLSPGLLPASTALCQGPRPRLASYRLCSGPSGSAWFLGSHLLPACLLGYQGW
jgi:hypothetical protein